MGALIAYVVSGTAAASVVTPVDTLTHTAGSSIVIGRGAQSIAVTHPVERSKPALPVSRRRPLRLKTL